MRVGQPSKGKPVSIPSHEHSASMGPRPKHTIMEGSIPDKNRQSDFEAQSVKQNTGKPI